MELTFNKVDNKYEAEFELSADANLHVEFKNAASVKLYQRTTGSGWDLVNDVKNAVGKATDVDLTSLIYPKFVKVVCVQEPTYANVTSDGEITEIKAQSKEIEVTSNGTTEVTPDAGFAYLNSVKVKTNVPQSGEGGGSASTMEYLDLSATDNYDVRWKVTTFSAFAKTYEEGEEGIVIVLPTYALVADGSINPINAPIAIAIDFSAKAIAGEPMTIKDLIISNGVTADQLAAIPRITEDQFYNINNVG